MPSVQQHPSLARQAGIASIAAEVALIVKLLKQQLTSQEGNLAVEAVGSGRVVT